MPGLGSEMNPANGTDPSLTSWKPWRAQSGAEVVFLSTPHEASLDLVPELLKANSSLRIVDLSGAYRFRNPETFTNWYKLPAPDAATLGEAVYGLPELYESALPQTGRTGLRTRCSRP